MTKLSIAVCVFNQENLILRALQSIPEREDIEVVVVNDGSTDHTESLVKTWMSWPHKYSIKYLPFSENRGIGFARNEALKASTGEYFGTLDSDDYFYTYDYEKVIDSIKDQDIVYLNLVNNEGMVYALSDSTNRLWCAFTNKCVKKTLFEGLEFKEEHKVSEDWFMNEDLLAKNPKLYFTGITAYHYNWPREGSLCWLASNGKL